MVEATFASRGRSTIRRKSDEVEQLHSLAGPVQLRRDTTHVSPYPTRSTPAEQTQRQLEQRGRGTRPGTPISQMDYRKLDLDLDLDPRNGGDAGPGSSYLPFNERARRGSTDSIQQQRFQQHHSHQRGQQANRQLPGYRPARPGTFANSYGPPLRSPPLMRERALPTDYYANLSAMNDLNRRRKYDQKLARRNAGVSNNAATVSAPTDLAPVMLFPPTTPRATPTSLRPLSEEREKENAYRSVEPRSGSKKSFGESAGAIFRRPTSTGSTYTYTTRQSNPSRADFSVGAGASKPVIAVTTSGLPRTGIRDDPSATSSSSSFATSTYTTSTGSLQSINLQSDVSAFSAVEDYSASNLHSGRTTVARALSLLSAVAGDTMRRDSRSLYNSRGRVTTARRLDQVPGHRPSEVKSLVDIALGVGPSITQERFGRPPTSRFSATDDGDDREVQFLSEKRKTSSSDHDPTPHSSMKTLVREEVSRGLAGPADQQLSPKSVNAQHLRSSVYFPYESYHRTLTIRGQEEKGCSDSEDRRTSRATSVLSNCSSHASSLEPLQLEKERHKRSSIQFLMNDSDENDVLASAVTRQQDEEKCAMVEHEHEHEHAHAHAMKRVKKEHESCYIDTQHVLLEAAHMAPIELNDEQSEMEINAEVQEKQAVETQSTRSSATAIPAEASIVAPKSDLNGRSNADADTANITAASSVNPSSTDVVNIQCDSNAS